MDITKEYLPTELTYKLLNDRMCVECGKEAKWVSKGRLTPYCDSCKKRLEKSGTQFIKITESVVK